jgi:hypothetical protein
VSQIARQTLSAPNWSKGLFTRQSCGLVSRREDQKFSLGVQMDTNYGSKLKNAYHIEGERYYR